MVEFVRGFYYFVVGQSVDNEAPDLIGNDGKVVPNEGDFALVRKFRTLRSARNFYYLMQGRYGVQKLHMCFHSYQADQDGQNVNDVPC
jgi:hypothetical protein